MIIIPQGEYVIGIDSLLALDWCKKRSYPGIVLHDRDGWILPMKAAFLRTRVNVSPISIGAFRPGPITYSEASDRARSEGGRLISEIEWEIAERYIERLTVPGVDEWCLEIFAWTNSHILNDRGHNSQSKAQEQSQALNRNAIRGANFPVYHPCMRFYSAEGNAPYASTGYRVVYEV